MPSLVDSLPSRQTAIIAQGPGKVAVVHDVLVPRVVSPNTAIVKTAAVAINPVDAKMLDYSAASGAVHGYDFAGIIVALAEEGVPTHLAVGDRVAGLVHGMNSLKPEIGAFADYICATADLLLKIPDQMSFEDAATLGMGLGTAGMALFKELNVPGSLDFLNEEKNQEEEVQKPPPSKAKAMPFILIYGGSTATGTRAIQLAKMSGLRPIATCSPQNFDLVRSFGAEQVFDYHDERSAAEIRSYTRNSLVYALDCISLSQTTQFCLAAIGRAGGRYVALEPYRERLASIRKAVKMSWIMMLTIFGERVALDGVYGRDAQPGDYEFGKKLFGKMQRLLDQGEDIVRTHPVQLMGGRWEGVVKGLDLIRASELSGRKLVYSI
ncbi:hypothetical protein UA08_00471 [Talaromyces atroroseus]|uniref:Enoyl reductase (ER) domain-containing protein n=1 Tax=Talaromyces atroroseus TaxID=1441469 RepID=A0A225B712_TALAT|nr:hypothetical protein UA08_00471 [Talaromyces atroroseus]OKL63919.1 hypothetical protein UA08_00471 [Talaromyces atroroseus]